MPKLFKRIATVNIGGREFKSPPFSIEIEQKVVMNATTTTICRLYNPNRNTIKTAEGTRQGNGIIGPQVIINAGYEDESGTCAVGQVSGFEVKHNKADVVLEMKIQDQSKIWLYSNVVGTWRGQTSSSLIRAVIGKVGITSDSIVVGTEKQYPTYSTKGRFCDIIQALCNDSNSEFFFQNGVLTVQEKSKPKTVNAVLLNSKTGLIGIPEKTLTGIKLNTLFLYKLQGGSVVKLESDQFNSLFMITKGKKQFSSFGKSGCEFEAVSV